ncbi:hypothetical protein PoB_000739000 [Plakobranchus ocellatus]|uniref:Uncharacterized protein n=1 Tax=Plakobranchus ocellatus TaxID=259542 RepID=A0AAV3YCX3_9GAST|nr:hypothetical protein PoB_000739000 [Plakobranchus ocellatus]
MVRICDRFEQNCRNTSKGERLDGKNKQHKGVLQKSSRTNLKDSNQDKEGEVRRRQHPTPRISKASAPVRRRQYPHLGYRRPVPQSAVNNFPTRDVEGQGPRPPSQIYPTMDIKSQCSSPPSPITSPG